MFNFRNIKNFLTNFAIFSLNLLIIACADIDRDSEKLNLSLKNIDKIKFYDYVTVESFEKVNYLNQTKFQTAKNKKTRSENLFLVKYDSLGNKIWSRNFEEIDNDGGISITKDLSGNIYLVIFLNEEQNKKKYSFLYNIFLIKFNNSGLRLWSKNLGKSYSNYGMGISVDFYKNIYVAGSFCGDKGDGTNFVIKFDHLGNKIWSKKLEIFDSGTILDIILDSSNKIKILGILKDNLREKIKIENNNIISVVYDSYGDLLKEL